MAALQDEISAWFVPSWNSYFGVVNDMADMLGAGRVISFNVLPVSCKRFTSF